MTDSREVKIADFLKRIKRPIRLDDDKEYKLVTVKMHHKGVVLREKKLGKNIGSNMYQVQTGDFILSGIDARNGAFGIVPDELDGAIVTNDFWYFEIDEEIIDKHFFLELTSTSWFDDICKKGSDGTTQRIRLQKDKFFNQTIILPSIKAQKPFIKKFLNTKSLNSELNAEMNRQTDLLTKLRQSILQEAIEGKLTVQWRRENPDIESVSKLLERIRVEKDRLIKEKKIKKEKPLSKINDDEIPFDVPDSWGWIRLGDVGFSFRGKSPKYAEKSDCFAINQKCVRWGYLDLKFSKKISQEWFSSIENFSLTKKNDILINSTGEGTIGRAAIVESESEGLIYDSHVLLFRSLIMPSVYALHCINSQFGQTQIDDSKGAKTTKQTELGVDKLINLKLPIPPFEEQKVLVKKIENFFTLCDELEQQINDSKVNAEMLMQVVLKEAFEG